MRTSRSKASRWAPTATRRVPARDIVGYVHVARWIGGRISRPHAEQLNDLLIATGPIGGADRLRAERRAVRPAHAPFPHRGGSHHARSPAARSSWPSARGSAELPVAGQWTFAYRGPCDPEPHRSSPTAPIPLIRANPAEASRRALSLCRSERTASAANPHSDYWTSALRRRAAPAHSAAAGRAGAMPLIHGGSPLLFADMYALGGGVALFPRADLCHPLPAGSALRITGRRKVRLDIPAQPGLDRRAEFKVGSARAHAFPERRAARAVALPPDSTITLMIDSDQTSGLVVHVSARSRRSATSQASKS